MSATKRRPPGAEGCAQGGGRRTFRRLRDSSGALEARCSDSRTAARATFSASARARAPLRRPRRPQADARARCPQRHSKCCVVFGYIKTTKSTNKTENTKENGYIKKKRNTGVWGKGGYQRIFVCCLFAFPLCGFSFKNRPRIPVPTPQPSLRTSGQREPKVGLDRDLDGTKGVPRNRGRKKQMV